MLQHYDAVAFTYTERMLAIVLCPTDMEKEQGLKIRTKRRVPISRKFGGDGGGGGGGEWL